MKLSNPIPVVRLPATAIALAAALLVISLAVSANQTYAAPGGSGSATPDPMCTSPDHMSVPVQVRVNSQSGMAVVSPTIVKVPACTIAKISWEPADNSVRSVSNVQACTPWDFKSGINPAHGIQLVDANTSEHSKGSWYYRVSVVDANGKGHSSQACGADVPPSIINH